MPYMRAVRYRLLKWARVILRSNDSPRQIAGGVAIGAFFSCNPTVVSQSFLAVVCATLFRCSRIPAFAMTWISNPFTVLPIYGTAYVMGAWLVGLFGFNTLDWADVKRLLFARPEELTFFGAAHEKLIELGAVSWTGIVPMEVGATLLGALFAAVTYPVALRLVVGHRLIKAQRMALRAKRRLERVLAQQSGRTEPSEDSAATTTAGAGEGQTVKRLLRGIRATELRRTTGTRE